ncbi:DeoR family transcriptional regulator [Salinisphaera sp.]|uniref:DeoR family transcriptional regulator n=1 Tax=Salinisphaera sp. TaxID=1914330 RepID=UPI002D78A2B0|nr:DeoR family transcriptional regulator [Salinisphaera sp.]HET7312986.1 DeoR family transcriptional regulator [Salinisphaera sp.]
MRDRNTALKRRLRVAERVRAEGSVRVNELADEFDVSVVTIRTDLGYLEERGYVIRSFGGAVSARGLRSPRAAGAASTSPAADEMLRVHQRLVGWLPGRGTVFLGGALLAQRLLPAVSQRPDLVAVSDAPAVAAQTAIYPVTELVLTGGRYRAAEGICLGEPDPGLAIDVAFVPLNERTLADTATGRHYRRIAVRADLCCGVLADALAAEALTCALEGLDIVIVAPSLTVPLTATLAASGFAAETADETAAVFSRGRATA